MKNIYVIVNKDSKAKEPFFRCRDFTIYTIMKGEVELEKVTGGKFFFRRKDALKYISWHTSPDFYEVLSIPFSV